MLKRLKSFVHIPVQQLRWWKIMARKPRFGAKVFCIGYNKTGTTTVGKSFEMLGLQNTSFNTRVWREFYKRGELKKVLEYTARFDSTDDLPWLKTDMIPLLDQTFPESKFVYLIRDEDSWLQSMETWALLAKGHKIDVEKELKGYRNHKVFVAEYFADWSEDRFLTLNIRDKNGFKKLADFLGIDTDRQEFPHFNRTSDVK